MKNVKSIIPSLILSVLVLVGCEQEKFINEPGNLVPKTVDQDPSLPSITVNGAKLHAEAFGNPTNPMLVVLHGGPGADYRYLLNCKEFSNQGFYVVFYDQRGTGLSQRFPYSIYTLQLAYDDLSAVIVHYRTSSTQKIFLLGHSWGAMLATAYINQNPTAIDGAILGEPGGFIWDDIWDYVSRSRNFELFGEDLNDAVYMEQFITGKENDQALLDYRFALWAAADGTEGSPTGNEGRLPFWRYGAVTNKAYFDLGQREEPNWTTNLNQYETKVLFIYSENNSAYGLAHAQKVSSAYTNVQLFKTLGAGHDMLSFPTGWSNTYPVMLEYLNSLK
jgi:proline iminopeptidase